MKAPPPEWRAVHEAGHALVAEHVGRRVLLATIEPVEGAYGGVLYEDGPDDDGHALLLAAGMAGEYHVFGIHHFGGVPARYAEAANVVTTMEELVGPRVGRDDAARIAAHIREQGDTGGVAAMEVRLAEYVARACTIIKDHALAFGSLYEALIEQRTLTGDEVRAVMREAGRHANIEIVAETDER